MKDFIFEPINKRTIKKCHELNEKNVPNVGSKSIEGLANSLENSDYSECIHFENQVIGFVICFLDSEKTKSYMKEIDHKNFREISNRVIRSYEKMNSGEALIPGEDFFLNPNEMEL